MHIFFQNVIGLFKKKNIFKSSKIDFFNYSPFIILIWSIFSVLYIAPIPIASGFGWDGIDYAKIALYWEDLIGHLDEYRAGRVLPSVLIHYSLKLLNIPFTLNSILTGFQVYNIIVIFGASIIWLKISKIASYNSFAKWLGFCALFINYPVLNWFFYYPAQTDSTAFLMGFLLLYGYLLKNRYIILVTSAVSFFCWPTVFFIGLLLYIYMEFDNSFYAENGNKRLIIFILSIVLGFITVHFIYFNFSEAISYIVFDSRLNDTLSLNLEKPKKIYPFSFNMFINSMLIIGYLMAACWIIVKNFDINKIIKTTFKKRNIIKLAIAIIILIILSVIKSGIYSTELKGVTITRYIRDLIFGSTRFPLQFIVCHIIYWGPSIILILIYWKNFIKSIKNSGLPIILGFLIIILFSINAEGRAITNFYPFIVFVLINAIDFDKIKNKRVFFSLFIFLSILFSKIWLPIALPSTVFPEYILTNLDKFPMQWYYMNFGLWINKEMFIIHSIAIVIFFIIFYVVLKSSRLRINQ